MGTCHSFPTVLSGFCEARRIEKNIKEKWGPPMIFPTSYTDHFFSSRQIKKIYMFLIFGFLRRGMSMFLFEKNPSSQMIQVLMPTKFKVIGSSIRVGHDPQQPKSNAFFRVQRWQVQYITTIHWPCFVPT